MAREMWERLKGALGVLTGRYAWFDVEPTPLTEEEREEMEGRDSWIDGAIRDSYEQGHADGERYGRDHADDTRW